MTATMQPVDGTNHLPRGPIQANEMVDKLLTLDQLHTRLAATEPLATTSWKVGEEQVRFTLTAESTAIAGTSANPAQPVNGIIALQGQEFALTRDALLEATSMYGLPKGYVGRCPSPLIEDQLNYWFNNGDKGVKLLSSGPNAMAFTRSTITPYSNLALLEKVTDGLSDYYGIEASDLLVDYKLVHNLRQTNFRVIVPETFRRIHSARDTDDRQDNWSLGIQVCNSLIGEKTTSLEGYLFAWWCTNGATSTHAQSGKWSRRGAGGGDEEAVYSWAEQSVNEILGKLDHEFDQLDALKDIELGEEQVMTSLRDVFEQYKVPVAAREQIIENMTETADLTAYGLHAAITHAANNPDLNPEAILHLLEIGGAYPHAVVERCDSCHRIGASH